MLTAPVYGCHILILLGIYVCRIIAFVNFQDQRDIDLFILFIDLASILFMIVSETRRECNSVSFGDNTHFMITN